jgi:hypothetical protein
MKQGAVDYFIEPVRSEKLTEVVSKDATGHVYKGQFKTEQAAETPFRHSRTSLAFTSGPRGEHPIRMLKKAVQQGHSKRRGEAYSAP